MSPATISRKPNRSTPCTGPRRHSAARLAPRVFEVPDRDRDDVRRRIRQLLEREINFIPNRCFLSPKAEAVILRNGAAHEDVPSAPWPRGFPAHLARLCESAPLSAAAERDLFRRMNYLKFRANALRAQLHPDKPTTRVLEAAERWLAEATAVRDRIVTANMRLVISIVRKFVSPQHPFDDLLSDGTMALMEAVAKFDYDRGFRFSTYAYRAIARNVWRTIQDRQKEKGRRALAADGVLSDVADERRPERMNEHVWNGLRGRMARLLQSLDRREQLIVRARFALGAHRQVRTFQSLGERLGISKERVRQLEQQAVEKLRRMATDGAAE